MMQSWQAALHAAVAATLWQLAGTNEYFRRQLETLGAMLTDDLCVCCEHIERLGVSDAALACVVAEGAAADASSVATVAYGARLLLRSARMHVPLEDSPLGIRTTCSSLQGALDVALEAGAQFVGVARPVIQGLRGFDQASGSAVLRILAAAYSDQVEDLILTLSQAPYCLDPTAVRIALANVEAQDNRQALSMAVANMRGAQAREAALALSVTLNAALAQDSSNFSLARCVQAVGIAIQADVQALLDSANAADQVWSQVPSSPPRVRVKNWLDSHSEVRLENGARIVPNWRLERPAATISFDDSAAMVLSWEALGAALELDTTSQNNLNKSGNQVQVSASLSSAIAEYVSTRASKVSRAWPHAQEPMPVRAPAMTFSASRLNAYVKCPRRWFYDYLCQALDDPPSLHAAYGRVVHDALEALHREIRVPSRYDPATILERLLRNLDAAFGKSRDDFGSQLEYEVSRCRARRMADQYVRWLTLEATKAPMEIIAVELFVRQRFGNHDFVGYVDRIDRPLEGGPVTIFDYKTGRLDYDAREYLDKVRRGEEAQLALYYAMRRAAGDDIARVALVSIRDPRDEAWILALDIVDDAGKAVVIRDPQAGVVRVACSREDLDASLAALLARCDFLTTQGHEHFPVGDDPPCNFCAYAGACRERPGAGERIFAR